MERPKTRYAHVDGLHIAYQELGSGPAVVYIPQWFSNVDALWQVPELARWVLDLARYRRVVLFDKRGTGLSDSPDGTEAGSHLEQFGRDLVAVLDAVGVERAAVVAGDSAGLLALWFAATLPHRVEQLVLLNSFARLLPAAEDTTDPPESLVQQSLDTVHRMFCEGDLREMAPSVADDPQLAERFVAFIRSSASPGRAAETRRLLLRLDLRALLSSVQARTLVMHRGGNRIANLDHARLLADGIPNSTLVEIPGEDHVFYFGESTESLARIEAFLTGARPNAHTERRLATLMFADVVDSTGRLLVLGDGPWQELQEDLRVHVIAAVSLEGGRLIADAGDGYFATLPGPGAAIRAASSLLHIAEVRDLRLRIGIHTGEVEVHGERLSGLTVNATKRIEEAAAPGSIWVSRTLVDLVAGSGRRFTDRGQHVLKGFRESWQLFEVQPEPAS